MLIKLTEYIYYRDGCRLYWSHTPINTEVSRDFTYNLVKKSENTRVVGKISGNTDKHRGGAPTTIQPTLNIFVLKAF